VEVQDIDDRLVRMVTLLKSHGYDLMSSRMPCLKILVSTTSMLWRVSKDQGLPSEGRSKRADESGVHFVNKSRLISDGGHFLPENSRVHDTNAALFAGSSTR